MSLLQFIVEFDPCMRVCGIVDGSIFQCSNFEKWTSPPYVEKYLAIYTHISKFPFSSDSKGSFDPLFITKLEHNFRSHPKLLDLPSRLFYESELVAKADKDMVATMLGLVMRVPNICRLDVRSSDKEN